MSLFERLAPVLKKAEPVVPSEGKDWHEERDETPPVDPDTDPRTRDENGN
jgi:hypothetical protein